MSEEVVKTEGMKICSRCLKSKLLSDFGKDKYKKDKLKYWCKSCYREFRVEKGLVAFQRRTKYADSNLNGNGIDIIYLKNGVEVFVDKDDYDRLIMYRWYNSHGYAYYKGKTTIPMHRLIMNASENDIVDHKNGNTLDNRKENLRICNYLENAHHKTKLHSKNTTGVNGVNFDKKRNKFISKICVNYKQIYLGTYDDLNDAIKSRNVAEIKYYGKFKSTIKENI